MKKLTSLLLLATCMTTATAQRTINVSVSNPLNTERQDVPVVIALSAYGDIRSALVTQDGKEIACQLDDLDLDETFDELCFLADLKGKEKKSYTVTLYDSGEPRPYPSRVYAEMVLANTKDKKLKKHQQNNFIESITARGDAAYTYNIQHHHGVDFESELNGIRIYFDARQTLDLYGKYHKQLELKETQFYTPAELKAKGYGDDVLWVGQTFGLGAFRGWDGQKPTLVEPVRSRTQRVVSYGPLRTIVEVIDRGWKADAAKTPVNMTLRYTQYAGHRDTDVDVFFNKDVSDYRFSTGVINVKGSEEYSDKKGNGLCAAAEHCQRRACQQGQLCLRRTRQRQAHELQGMLHISQRELRLPFGTRMVRLSEKVAQRAGQACRYYRQVKKIMLFPWRFKEKYVTLQPIYAPKGAREAEQAPILLIINLLKTA